MNGGVPVALSSFIGRESELAEVGRLLSEYRLVTVGGAGGVGKTRLVAEAAPRLAAVLGGSTWWADLTAVSEPELLPEALFAAVGRRDIVALPGLLRHLRRRRGLLVLDNCERLAEAFAPLVEELLRGCPQLRVLASSREPLRAAGEVYWTLRPMALEAEAVPLFVERARAVTPEFEPSADVAAICRRLDCIPLAIELAASRVRVLSLAEITRRLDQRFELLAGGPRTARAEHRTLRAAVDWSYDMLPGAEQRLLRRLSIFAGGWTLAAADAVCAESGSAVEDLGKLVEKSLVVAEPWQGDRRYRLLETMREYAREKLAAAGELDALRDRHLGWAVDLMRRLGPRIRGAEQGAVFAELEVEHANLSEALEWSIASGRVEAGLRITEQLWWFWFPRGYTRQAASLLRRLLGVPAAAAGPELRAGGLEALAVLERDLGDVAGANAAAQEALAIRRRLDDRLRLAEALVIAGWARIFEADFGRAGELWSENLALAEAIGAEWNAAEARIDLGWLHAVLGDLPLARGMLDAGVAAMRGLGSDVYVAYGLFFSGYAALFEGRCAEARALLGESLSISQRLGGRRLMEPALTALAGVAAREGMPAAALRLAGATEALREELGLSTFPGFHDRIQPWIEKARLANGRRAAALIAAGRELDFEQALAEALRFVDEGRRGSGRRPLSGPGRLSQRQATVAALVAEGLSNRQIAAALSLADGTIKRHVEDILTRLGLDSRAQIAVWAVQNLN
jgi:predicted ATPase/DNA-binding CsgD family transcriptional regulator